MIKEDQVTIIIPHYGGSSESEYAIEQCLTSLEETVPDIDRIVVKNGPMCFHEGDMKIKRQGQNKAVNAAVATTNTPWIMVTNDDMVYSWQWFKQLTKSVSNEVSCISPKLIEPRKGAPTFEVYFCGGAGGDFDKAKWLEFSKSKNDPQDGQSISSSMRTGFNLPFLIHRDLWNTIGGYDINYDPWGSNGDSDLEYKIRLAGVQPYQNTETLVYHFSQTSGTFNPENRPYWGRNFAYFKEKWGFERTDTGIWEANFEMPKPPARIYCPPWEGKYA